jgi:hypothetical protein
MEVNIIPNQQTKLSDLKLFSSAQLKKLNEYSISSAEQFVGACATPEGFAGIKQMLGLSQNKLNQMLYELKNQLPIEMAELLSKPTSFSPSMGARQPQKKAGKKKKI